ncbi:MAG: sigma 54-interacting transcriptional regulator, partial [bacterium]
MHPKQIKVLLIAENPEDKRLLKESLTGSKDISLNIECADSLSIGLKRLLDNNFDVVLLDLSLPDSQGLDTFIKVRDRMPKMPVIVMTGLNDENLAIKTVKEGAQDYIFKGQADGNLLLRSIRYAIERKRCETKSKEMIGKLRKCHDDLLSILNQLPMGVAMTDKDGCIKFVSDTCQQLLGKERGQILGLPWSGALFSEEETRDSLKSMIANPSEKREKIPSSRLAEDGQQYWMEIDVKEDPRDRRSKIFFIYDISEIHYLQQQLNGKAQFYDLIGKSKSMKMVYQQIQDLATVDSTVLIEGDTGTGKELVARAIHFSGRRKMNPFVIVNCAGLTESLVESQLYGHTRGAFTGAVSDQVGLFEAADGGTLFLDEIGDIPLALQTNFLRAIQEKEIRRIGEFKTVPVNVRIIAAT